MMTDTLKNMDVKELWNFSSEPWMMIDNQGVVVSCNEAACRLLNKIEDDIVGKLFTRLLEFGDQDVRAFKNYLNGQGLDHSLVDSRREYKVKFKPLAKASCVLAKIEKASYTGSDGEAVFKNVGIFKAIFDAVKEGLILLDRYGRIQCVNPSVEDLFNYSASLLHQLHIKSLTSDLTPSEENQLFKDTLGYSHIHEEGIVNEVSAIKKDGSTFPAELTVINIAIEGDDHFLVCLRDITDRKKSEKIVEKSIKDLKRSNQELDDFAYIASHDLKEPLRGISNNALFLEEDYAEVLGDDGVRRIDRMKFLCQRLEQLVDNLLYFSRLGRQDFSIQQVDCNYLIQEIKDMMEHQLEESNVEIKIPVLLPVITCDAFRVTEVFRNLIANAIKYNDKDIKVIEIGIDDDKSDDLMDVFYVKDNGIGISKEFYSDVFKIFKRLNVENENARGSGVGLTFVKKIIERHGGKIWVESEEGQGTTFFFSLKKLE